VTSSTKGSDRGVTAPGPLFYLTEPARAVIDFGLLTSNAPLPPDARQGIAPQARNRSWQ
jgi:hypothetical protein